MAGSAIVDIRTTIGAIFVGLLFSTTSVLLFSVFPVFSERLALNLKALWYDTRADVS
jgi:hypothetical protein